MPISRPYSIGRSLSVFVSALYLGVADTVWVLSGIYYGEEDRRALDELQTAAYRVGNILAFVVTAALLLFSRSFAGIYLDGSDAEILELASQAVRFFALSVPLYVAVYIFEDYLMGTGKLKSANLYGFFLELGAVVPVVWVMVHFFGGRGAWFAMPVSLLIMDLVSLIYIFCWREGETFRIKRLLLHSRFGSGAGEELNISADTMEEVVGLSRLAKLFCSENGVDPKKANNLALCIEELGINIIEHGFSDGKPHSIDIRILAKDDDLILRIRDDCRPFNLPERYAMTQQQEAAPLKNIGIRMVMKASKDVKYLSTMSTNNLIIRI